MLTHVQTQSDDPGLIVRASLKSSCLDRYADGFSYSTNAIVGVLQRMYPRVAQRYGVIDDGQQTVHHEVKRDCGCLGSCLLCALFIQLP